MSYTEQNPSNRKHKSETFDVKLSVTDWEMVEVPAGKYRALKIEGDGRWQAEIAASQTVVQGGETDAAGAQLATNVQKTTEHEASGRMYRVYWYVPEVKRWVKSVEEYYSSAGIRNERITQELESFTAVAGGLPASSLPSSSPR